MDHTRKKILIFDDDEDILSICSYVLEEEDYEVISFADAENVIERVKTVRPEIIFMDSWLPPGNGGVEAVRLLKSDTGFKDIPVILFSANSDIKNLAKNAGADAFLAKPFDLADLAKAIKSTKG